MNKISVDSVIAVFSVFYNNPNKLKQKIEKKTFLKNKIKCSQNKHALNLCNFSKLYIIKSFNQFQFE